MNIIEQDKHTVWHPFTQAKNAKAPIEIKSAQGAYLYTADGHKLFDGISSWWVNAHGHCHPHIAEAIAKQAHMLDQVIFATFTHEPAVKLANLLTTASPFGHSRVFFSDNGSTAVETALKMALQYWHNKGEQRLQVIALEHGYHGDTFGAMAASDRSVFTKPFWPLLFEVLRSKSATTGEMSDGRSEEQTTAAALASLRSLLEKHEGKVAAIVIEPMLQGAGGMKIFTRGFLKGIKELALEYNTLLIADEVATGFFRTGLMFACEHESVAPDIMCLAKGLTGGSLPLAVTLTTEKIFEAFLGDSKAEALLHGHSFTANPLGCAASIASLELFAREETIANVKAISKAVSDGMAQFDGIAGIKEVRSIGTVFALELHSDHGYLSSAASKITDHCFKKGLYLRPLGNVIYLLPPLCSSPAEIAWSLEVIKEGLTCT